jgi:hypothetical protein
MIKTLFRAAHAHSAKALLAASLAVGTSMVSGAATAANIDLSTGIDVTGNIDNRWTVAYPSQTANTVQTLTPGFPAPPWILDSASPLSNWVVPTGTGQNNAPQNTDFVYTTTFTLADQAAADSSLLSGRWLSDNETVSITLNGVAVAPGVNSAASSYSAWTSLIGNGSGDFVVGQNTLVFTVHNGAGSGGNPTGFRFEGGVEVGAVPEPSSLVLSAIGTLLLGRFSWKRRLALRNA